MKILAFDTTGLVATVALVQDGRLLAEYSINHKKTHSQTLMVMTDEIIKQTDTDLSTVDAIALSGGPGSFTGLRIGSASAKGLAFALGKPIVSVPTIEALSYNLWGSDKYICPMLDARRNQAFTGIYKFENEDIVPVMPQTAMDVLELIDRLNKLDKPVILLGDGIFAFRDILIEKLEIPYSFAPASHCEQRASVVASLAEKYVEKGMIETADEHVPHYYRLSQAEREKLEKELVIKPLEEADIDTLCEIERQSFSLPWNRQNFLDLAKNDCTLYLVAHLNGEVIGCAGLWNMSGDGNITNVVIRSDMHRKGYGERIVATLMEEGLKMGVTAYTLEVRTSNTAAIKMYEKLGFVSEGVRPKFYEKPVEDALIMWKR